MVRVQKIILHVDLKTMAFDVTAPKVGDATPFEPAFFDLGDASDLLQELCEKIYFAYANPDSTTSQSSFEVKLDGNKHPVHDPHWKLPSGKP